MKLVLALALALFVLVPSAEAYTCKEVRDYACSHTPEELQAIKRWMTKEQIRQALWCLKHSKRC